MRNLDIYGSTLSNEDANTLISKKLLDNSPLMISRFDSTELKFVLQYLKNSGNYTQNNIRDMYNSSGFFAFFPEDSNIDKV